ncbi:MAG: hypothetical protein K1V84_06990 [Muribaculaceae bacterium]
MKRFVLILSLLLAVSAQIMAEKYVVSVTTANIRDKGSMAGKVIGTLQRGFEIEVDEVTGGFAKFDFLGREGFTSVKNLKKAGATKEAALVPNETRKEKGHHKATAPMSKSEAVVYLFYDCKFYLKSLPISINGKYAFGMEGESSVGKMTGERFTPSKRKLIVHGDGRMVLSLDFTWADKPYHSEMPLNITDGQVYYVRIGMESNIFKAFGKKRTGIYFEQLNQKEGLKMMENKKFTENPDFDINL